MRDAPENSWSRLHQATASAVEVSQFGFFGDVLQSVVILYTKSPEDYTNGDVLTLASATLGIVGFAISGGPFAAAASAGGCNYWCRQLLFFKK